jgi:hypothetical protein
LGSPQGVRSSTGPSPVVVRSVAIINLAAAGWLGSAICSMGQPTTTMQHLESVHLQVAWLTSKIDGAGLIQIPKAYVARELRCEDAHRRARRLRPTKSRPLFRLLFQPQADAAGIESADRFSARCLSPRAGGGETGLANARRAPCIATERTATLCRGRVPDGARSSSRKTA